MKHKTKRTAGKYLIISHNEYQLHIIKEGCLHMGILRHNEF